MSLRDISPGLAARWKVATKRAVHELGNAEAAALAGLSAGALSRMAAGHFPDILPLDAALAIADASGTRAFAEVFADMAGCRLASRRGGDDPAPLPMPALAAAISEAAEFVHVAAQALADGKVSQREAHDLMRVIGDHAAAMADVECGLTALSRRVSGEAGR
jgi:hypothetical protein